MYIKFDTYTMNMKRIKRSYLIMYMKFDISYCVYMYIYTYIYIYICMYVDVCVRVFMYTQFSTSHHLLNFLNFVYLAARLLQISS